MPDVQITLTAADSTCSASGTPNGVLSARADGFDDTNTNYTFQWHTGSGTGSPIGGATSSTLSGLAAGTYTLLVGYTPSSCTTTEEFIVPNVPAEIAIESINTTAATSCGPGDGTITVTSVSTGNIADYTFDYYDVDPTVGSPTPVFTGAAGAAYTAADGGVTYYVIGTNTILDCQTLPFEVTVGSNFVLPEIQISSFEFQTNCDPSNPNGSLTILADGVTPPNVQWYFGSDTSTPLTDGLIGGNGTLGGATTATVTGIPAGFYTVEVTNANGCSNSETYEMADDIPNPIEIAISTSANTNCVNFNGQAGASVISPAPGRGVNDYIYYWYVGDQRGTDPISADPLNPFPAPDFTGALYTGLEARDYTVFVVDTQDTFCRSQGTLVNVPSGTTPPEYTLDIENHVTVCFDVKDGFASVEVPDFSKVDIEWIDDASNVISTQFFADSLEAGSYIVSLTDVNTGCVATEVFNIENRAIIPSDPLIILNNNRTNCTEPNGSAIANVDGDQTGYIFEWFHESDLSTPYTTGAEVFNLDSATYLVRATNLATGCESALSSLTVEYEILDPVFELIFSQSACLRTEDGAVNQFDGNASVFIDETTNPQQFAGQLKATNYEWRDASGNLISEDAKLIDVAPGAYTVTFIARNGCTYSASFDMSTNLTVYNGVSANDDGMNDFFLIDCVDYFSGNSVKIYNRAGSLVYKVDNYDNVTTRFTGFSNIGRNERQLPVGTYYYLIDKGDGSDVIQGYLELVR